MVLLQVSICSWLREFYVNVEWYLQKDKSRKRGDKPGFLYAKCVKEQELPTKYDHSPHRDRYKSE